MALNIKAKIGEFPRTFVPEGADMGDWAQMEPLFAKLENEDPRTAEELEAWLLKLGEFGACIGEEISRRHIAMTCDTADKEAE